MSVDPYLLTADAEEPTDARVHVPLGADVELYDQMASWAPAIAGFQRFDLRHDTPGLIGPPGVELARLSYGDAIVESHLFVVVPFDGNSPSGYVTLEGMDTYAQSFTIDQLNDWQGYNFASVGEGLFGVGDPLVFRAPTVVSFYVGDNQGADPGSSQGLLALILRVLPAPPTYP